MQRYRNPALKQLRDQQIKYAPRDVQLTQISRAERLMDELNPAGTYRYPEICEKITTYRGEMYPDLVVSGAEAVHDLRCFVEDLSENADISADSAGEEVWTVEDVSKRFNVSSKTVSRWRDRGLVSRRFRFGGRKRVGFLRSSVERFVTKHAEDVDRGSQFSQLSVEEREKLIQRARRLAKAGGCPTEISHRLARKFRRSPETVRYTLKNYDKDHPEAAVFPNALNTITEEHKLEIYRSFRKGVPVDEIAQKFGRTRASIYRMVAEVRAEQLLEKPIDFMSSPMFEEADAAAKILQPAPVAEKKSAPVKTPPGLPPYLNSLYAVPLLTKDEEVYYFRKMNFLLYQASKLQGQIDLTQPKTKDMDAIERLIGQANEVKNFLIRSNLRLVVSIAKKHMKPNSNFFEMVSDGNISLIRAIEKFDYTRGFKFSTYASWAIMKNFARSIPAEYTQLERFRTGNEEVFHQASDPRSERLNEEVVNKRQHEALMQILSQLDPRERDIIVSRYGLKEGKPAQTLEQVGQKLGVTKERIRQLESRALQKLRKIAEDEHLDVPGI
ncbi:MULTISPECIES: sigma-70 family RNA polymerase sigma factor [unclassified Schlesneria]|uniref:sigma-70 family RNA polymerase sigma factor n=1 Tax=Schlesneria TaxID=656899 RepID=UPI002F059917